MDLSILRDRKMFCPSSNIHTVGLHLESSCAQASFLDWASNLPQLRHLKARNQRSAGRASSPRRSSKFVRRLIIWGFIGANGAISIAWAHAADEAAAAINAAATINAVASAAATGGRRLIDFLLRRPSKGQTRPSPDLKMVYNLFLTLDNLWTMLTCAVCHVAPCHLIAKMCEFCTWASRCFDLGLGPGAVASLMLGSAVCCSAAGAANQVATEVAWEKNLIMGASGIISGLRAAAILLEPVMGFRVPGVSWNFRWPLFPTLLMSFSVDLIGILRQHRVLPAPKTAGEGFLSFRGFSVGYAGHLGRTAFGVAYWFFWLRSRFGTR